jgi:hypothetical protein
MSGSISDPRAHGTCRSFGSPFLDLRKELTLRHGDWSATVARSPTPEYEWRVHMLHNLLGRTMAVLLGIFEQFTELMVGQTLPDHRHRGRRQMPTGRSGGHVQAREIVILMTGAAADGINSLSVSTANLHCVVMAVVTLTREVSTGVAIHAARVAKHRNNCFESSSGTGIVARRDFMDRL